MALKTLLLLMILDYITGLICAGKGKNLSSSAEFRVLAKKNNDTYNCWIWCICR